MRKLKKVNNSKLDDIVGGSSNNITGSIINAFVNVIKLLMEAGEGVGSSIRRVAEGSVCPLK